MIVLLLDDMAYEQDIRELLLAIYPNEKVIYENVDKYKVKIEAKKQFNKNRNLEEYILNIYLDNALNFHTINIDVDFNRSINKNNIKKYIYLYISSKKSIYLPWGTLTGIRPTKLISNFLEEKKDISYIRNYMKNTYLISEKKLNLCLDTALKEQYILSKIDYEKAYSLYIGIPFCPTTCAYCSFTSYPISKYKSLVDKYLEALEKEIKEISKLIKNKVLQTIYIGGGTPSALSDIQIDRLLCMIKDNFNLSNILEYSFEAGRPDSITKEKLDVLKKYNITRVSINPQTMKDETLKIIGRKQTKREFLESFKLARDLGFDNINTDIILGLPDEDLSDVKNTMKILKELNPESITVHSLAIKRAARLNTNKEEFSGNILENTENMIEYTFDICKSMNLKPYYLYRQKNMIGNFENVGFAKNDKECIYNILIMEEKQDIIALGAGTTTKVIFNKENRLERVENVKDPILYIERIDEMIERKKKVLKNKE